MTGELIYMNEIINFLNQNAGAIQGISTVILVIVTIWYAFSTKRMSDLMKSQITSKILIEKISIGTSVLEEYFLKEKNNKNSSLTFKMIFDVRNEGNASGSIYKPSIVISLLEHKIDFIINPKTKDYEIYNHKNNGYMSSYDTRTINHGSAIFLQGGESNRIELEYEFNINTDEKLDFINEIQKNPTLLKYHLLTTDNLGNEYKLKVNDIFKERNFGLD